MDPRERQTPHEGHAGNVTLHQPVAVAPRAGVQAFNGYWGGGAHVKSQPSEYEAGLPAVQAPAHRGQEADTLVRDQMPLQQQQQAVSMGQPQTTASGMRPSVVPPGALPYLTPAQQPILNDALSYLDQVKVQFADYPDVYNRFLDIMKDFKSSAIDTPGVIDRVSHLFAGHPNLIQGFNTFLPPGYKIECGTTDDPNAIRVTTPMGTTMQTMPGSRTIGSPRSHPINGSAVTNERNFASNERSGYSEGPVAAWAAQQQQAVGTLDVGPDRRHLQQPGPMQQGSASDHYRDPTLNNPIDQRGVAQLQTAAVVAPALQAAQGRSGVLSSPSEAMLAGTQAIMNGAAGLPNMNSAQAQAIAANMEKRGPVEFNHAISYVNKIKNRFATQPDIYKQFLEILQTYQRESKPIQDVYAQVTRLFETAPDLLEDFKQFLPESAAQAKANGQRMAGEDAFPISSVRVEQAYAPPMTQTQHQQQQQQQQQTPARVDQPRLPPMGNFAPTPSANRDNKRKRGEKGASANTNASVQAPMAPLPQPDLGGNRVAVPAPANPNKRAKHAVASKPSIAPEVAPVSPSLVPALPLPMPPNLTTSPTAEDINFFDRVRKHINNKAQYTEFLKLTNLYTQDLCTGSWLVYRASTFIGNNPELYKWFKNFIGAEPEDELVENKPVQPTGKIALSNCRGLGPSYRLLPRMEQNKLCSGRDQLCQEVLNDEWVSHPTWASEDSGFVAHRKNQYEEGLHRIEEERHDYDTHIGVVERTIQLLEPIAQQMAHMSPEQRKAQTLDKTLGGQSEAIYKRAIFKIYGRESGQNVVHRLLNDPYDCVPILLTRCKQMRESWKASQREWNKVWRTQTSNMFWRSLDHQGAGSRQDRRQFTLKYIQSELMAREEAQKRIRDTRMEPTLAYQFESHFTDMDVLYDCFSLLLVHVSSKAEAQDQPKLEPFLREFASVFFKLEPNALREGFGQGDDEDSHRDAESMSLDDSNSAKVRISNRKGVNLLRGVLERGKSGRPRRDNDDSIASDSRGSSPQPQDVPQQDEAMPDGGAILTPPPDDDGPSRSDAPRWLNHPTDDLPGVTAPRADEPYRRDTFNMYANWTLYSFFRLISILYERLLRIKQWEPEVKAAIKRENVYKPANDIGWIDKVPRDFFEGTDRPESTNFFLQMLNKFETQIREGSPDFAADVEETLRRFYLYHGWQLYNCEKLVASAVKAAIGIVASYDNKDHTSAIWNAYRKDRLREETTHNDELSYRKQVEKLAKDSDIIKISWNEASRTAHIKLMRKEDATFSGASRTEAERWQAYIASFGMLEPTEAINYDDLTLPVLPRNMPKNWTKTGGATLPGTVGSGPSSVNGSTANSTGAEKANGDTNEVAEQLEGADLISEEQLQTRIAFHRYTLAFQSGTQDFSYRKIRRLPAQIAENLAADLQKLEQQRDQAVESNIVWETGLDDDTILRSMASFMDMALASKVPSSRNDGEPEDKTFDRVKTEAKDSVAAGMPSTSFELMALDTVDGWANSEALPLTTEDDEGEAVEVESALRSTI